MATLSLLEVVGSCRHCLCVVQETKSYLSIFLKPCNTHLSDENAAFIARFPSAEWLLCIYLDNSKTIVFGTDGSFSYVVHPLKKIVSVFC